MDASHALPDDDVALDVTALLRAHVAGDPDALARLLPRVYDTLLALHLISAVIAFVTVVMFSAWVAGAPLTRGTFVLSDAAWNVSGAGLLIFGVWLAFSKDPYEIWDAWIIAAMFEWRLPCVIRTAFGSAVDPLVSCRSAVSDSAATSASGVNGPRSSS